MSETMNTESVLSQIMAKSQHSRIASRVFLLPRLDWLEFVELPELNLL